MLTKNEITALSLSPTKKDFVQIWNELLEVAGKLSERWDPTSTNESDPGIVILKALTGIADKLNYNIDKNTLEAFMPTAAQEDSMRKLCDMLGYTMKYYRSAETTINIKYYNADPSEDEANIMSSGLYIPKFTVITNSDQDISYFTTNKTPIYISSEWPSVTDITCMEGQIVRCESINSNNIITINQVSENNRFYLPETQIAENGVFIYNVTNDYSGDNTLVDGTEWTRVDNLNVQTRGARVFKFGYDSYESRPYIEFPADYSELFNEGLSIYYTRTSGANGNISTRTLTQLELPTTAEWAKVSAESFSVENVFSATSGANPETIKQAYGNYKKTIGTFETLVTCRDYMNKIYSMVNDKTGKPLVSNILVTDIRNDLNRAVTICSCDDAGIFYSEVPFVEKTVSSSTEVIGNETIITKVIEKSSAIDHFDLVFYPFKSYNQIKSNVKDIKDVYDASFTYTNGKFSDITSRLDAEGIKNISHNIKTPRIGDLLSINNYLRLTATIATNAKVTDVERNIIIDNIKIALANAFNMRELDFGDEIPFDSIIEVIETADSRIRVASLNEPALYTTFSVLEADTPNSPTVVEYAVASDWLDADMAASTGRFTKTKEFVNDKGETETKIVSTFNTKEAKQIYNNLAIRNVLAGRVPLFNYNNTFKTSFSESAYQVTNTLDIKPNLLAEPTKENPFTIWVDSSTGIIYTGQLVYDEQTDDYRIVYTETKTPEEYDNIIKDNVIQENTDDNTNNAGQGTSDSTGTAGDTSTDDSTAGPVKDYITNISTSCKLFADEYDTITDVTLADGEFVRFRAPNFMTVKTYPAYVNYHLDLDTAIKSVASPAEAVTLFSILNSDITEWSNTNRNINWQKVLDYFKNIDRIYDTSYKKTFTLKQMVCANKVADSSDISIQQGKLTTTIGVSVDNNPTENVEYTVDALMALSGCVKLTNKNFKARIEWTPQEGESKPVPNDSKLPELVLELNNPFITSTTVLADIQSKIDEALATYKTALFDKTVADDCIGHSFTVYLDFECVPFEAKSLAAWEKFVSTCALYYTKDYKYQVFNFKPIDDNDSFLWRISNTNSYDVGKYVTADFNKLLKFNKNYFNSLDNVYLKGIYIIESAGADAEPFSIKNNEEYKLRQNERLYIEYTPSTTTEDGSAQAAVTEVYGEGTIIRPNGFDTGLLDSSVYASLGNTSNKQVIFTQVSNTPIDMFSFSASEQLEIRDLAKVELSKDSFSGTSGIYVYKNFNGCRALETIETNASGERINNTYTLKDGEYIFYTDQNKSDFAYYTSGTQVTLLGSLTLPEFDIIELSTIFDSGLQEIPWKYKVLEQGDRIIFQEFQYITLGSGDTIKNLVLVTSSAGSNENDAANHYLDETWQYCADVKYTIADAPDTSISLVEINLPDRQGNGWEASSTLELDVTPNSAQTLRSTDKVETSLILSRTSTDGGRAGIDTIKPITSTINTSTTSIPLSFKTNVACQACTNNVDIEDIYYNPSNVKGFQLKVFATDEPVIVETLPGSVAPYAKETLIDIATWTGEPLILSTTNSQELWNQLALDRIRVANMPGATGAFDNALRLPISLLQNTYGIFCIYVDSTKKTAGDLEAEIWIEAMPGTEPDSITMLNAEGTPGLDKDNRLYLHTGINCVCIRKSCKIFIKASKTADGIIYFDEPKLVNSQRLEYKNANEKSVPLYTSGLNLTQLGYLDTSVEDSSTLDEATRTKLLQAYVDKANTELDSIIQNVNTEIFDSYSALTEISSKIQTLVDAEQAINEELLAISSMNSERLGALILKYNELSTTLQNENALLSALENNIKADEIEQQLAVILADLTAATTTQQQILEELVTLKANTTIENISGASILADYHAIAAASDLTETFKEIQDVAINTVEKSYQEQLSTLVANLEQVVNSDERNSLLTILAKLRATETSSIQTRLRVLVNKLNDTIESTTINNTLTEMAEAAVIPDYSRLYSLINTLSGLIESRGMSVIAAEISQITGELTDDNSAQLANLITELKALVKQLGNTETGLRADIDALATAVKAKIDSGATALDSKISDSVKAVRSKFISDFKAKLTEIITSMEQCCSELQTVTPIKELVNLLESLEDSQAKNSQVRLIVNNIKAAINERNYYLTELSAVSYSTWEDSSVSEFIHDAILVVWPNNMSARLYEILLAIEAIFVKAINGKVANFNTYYNELLDILNGSANTRVLVNNINTTAFTALFSKIKTLLSTDEQTAINKSLVTDIGGLIENSEELITALNNTGNNTIIRTLLSDWQNATDIIQKQQLQSTLKEELKRVIALDEQLFSIIANLLCPNIEKLAVELPRNESFYEKLFDALDSIKDALLESNSVANIVIPVDTEYLELFKLSFDDFKIKLRSLVKPKTSLLPDDIILDIDTTKDILTAIESDKYSLGLQPITRSITSDDLAVLLTSIINSLLKDVLAKLKLDIAELETADTITPGYEDVFRTLRLEDQLLAEIKKFDVNNEFYYGVPVEDRLAIEFNESDKKLNTLMNPLVNYDINNINNSFVISKLDINYLDNGIQIARSSRLN